MDLQNATTEEVCPRAEIAAYLDRELSPSDELSLEQHFAVCKTCFEELNLQKQLLSALDFAFEGKTEIELPENFTKVVVAKAESRVTGLRSRKERIWTLSICAAVLFLSLIGIILESDQVFYSVSDFSKQFIALAGFVNHLIFDITIGIAVILRFLSQQIVFSPGFIILLLLCLSGLMFLSFSRLVIRFGRS